MRPRPLNRLLTLLTPTASGTRRAVTALCLVTNLCFLGTPPSLNAEPAQEKPPVPAGAQAPPYVPGRLPYRLQWGTNTVVAEVERGKVGDDDPHQPRQVRIVDASGRLLRRIEADRVEDVRLVKPLVAGEQGLLVGTTGGNSGLVDYDAFGTGVANRFHVSDAVRIDVRDLNGDGTAEVIAVYRLSDIDGGGEHHGPRVTVVYQWNGTKYAESTRRFPALTRAQEKEDQVALAAIEAKTSQSDAAPGASDSEIDGHHNAAVGYLMNAMIAGDGAEAQAWLKDNVRADRLQLSGEVRKSVWESVQSMLRPLAQDAGDDPQASVPAPNNAAPKEASPNRAGPTTAQSPQKAGVVPGQSLGILRIGEARADVIAAIKMRPTANYDLKNGLVEDEWSSDSANGSGEGYNISVWYRQGKVIQAQTTLTEQQRANVPTFNALVAQDRGLKEVCYYMGCYDSSGPAGGADFYCFDDVRRGIAYGIGVNGDAYMTDKPRTLIIHVAGVPYIPFQGQTNVTRVTGSILYQNQAEQDRAGALETKLRSSQARSHKKH